jgi:hypothetical protein
VTDVEDVQRSKVADLIIGGIYMVVIGANAWLAYDWWRETPEGQIVLGRLRGRLEALRAKAQECEGCAKRKAMLKGAINRMHWDAERIIEGEDVPTTTEL